MTNTDSSFDHDDLSSEEIHIRNFTKSMLLSRIFLGTYQEKRYVQSINEYRDVIRIQEDESDLIKALHHVKTRIEAYYKCWLGITETEMIGAPVGTCLWVELPEQIFGKYWFKIKSIRFKSNEIIIRVKLLRSAQTPDRVTTATSNIFNENQEIKEKTIEILTCVKENLITLFAEVITTSNIKNALVFLSALFVTIFIGAFQFLQYAGEYSLKLFRELSIFINSISPVLIAIVNMIGKTFNGLYYLIYLLWTGNNKSTQHIYNTRNDYSYAIRGPNHQRALPYRRSGVQITELN